MKCAWNELLAILPQSIRKEVDMRSGVLQELRLRLGRSPELVTGSGSIWLRQNVIGEDIRFVVNTASRYSPWTAASATRGYITAAGGHRIGLFGEVNFQNGAVIGMREITSLNIRVARDIPVVTDKLSLRGNLLIVGPPGSGKTTFLRDLSRRIAQNDTVCVVDERGELFPVGFEQGRRMDVLTGCPKAAGIEMALRTMGPAVIAVDEITAREDTNALQSAAWCGVTLIATAHASDMRDLKTRTVYRSILEQGLFDRVIILHQDKSWHEERVAVCC